MLLRPEVALSEILSLEIGLDIFGVPQEVDFASAGAATAGADTGATASVAFSAGGDAAGGFDATLVVPVVGLMEAAADTDLRAWAVRNSTLSAPSGADVAIDAGRGLYAAFAADGVGEMGFEMTTEPGFDIGSGAEASFDTEALKFVDWGFGGEGTVAGVAQALPQTRLSAAGEATVDGRGGSTASTRADSVGTAGGTIRTQVDANTTAEAEGAGALTGRAQARTLSEVEIAGEAEMAFDAGSFTRVRTRAAAAGAGELAFASTTRAYIATSFALTGGVDMALSVIGQHFTTATAAGASTAEFMRGREVQPNLARAFDVVQRPEENRLAEWR